MTKRSDFIVYGKYEDRIYEFVGRIDVDKLEVLSFRMPKLKQLEDHALKINSHAISAGNCLR